MRNNHCRVIVGVSRGSAQDMWSILRIHICFSPAEKSEVHRARANNFKTVGPVYHAFVFQYLLSKVSGSLLISQCLHDADNLSYTNFLANSLW